MQCPDCKSEKIKFTVKLIPTHSGYQYFPKFVPQVKRLCGECGRYLRFEPQSQELIDKFNIELEEVSVNG